MSEWVEQPHDLRATRGHGGAPHSVYSGDTGYPPEDGEEDTRQLHSKYVRYHQHATVPISDVYNALGETH